MKKIVHIIHHTHWDLEWFFTIEDSSTILQHQIYNVIENVDKHNIPYLFDGQVGVFEKLSNDSDVINSIKALCSQNKLFVGPWFSQPDLRLSSRESIIRNLEIGKDIAKKYLSSFDVLYTPDTFGFNLDIAHLYKNLNYKWTILWRGVDRQGVDNSPIFKWGDKDSNIFVYNIAGGYFVGRYLYNDERFEEIYQSNIVPSVKYQSHNDKIQNIAIPFGGDQMFFNKDLPIVVDKLNAKNDGCFYKISTWQEFLKELENEINEKQLDFPLYSDSLNKANGGRLHKTISSTRVDIKQLIYQLENKIVNVLEPLYSTLDTNMKYPKTLINDAWKKLLLSQAHDSYGGCNSDEVNANIKNRLIRTNHLVDANIGLALNTLGKNYLNKLIFVNPINEKGSFLFKALVITDKPNFELKHKGNTIDCCVLNTNEIDGGVKVFYTSTGEIENKLPSFFTHEIVVKINGVESFSINEIDVVLQDFKNATNISETIQHNLMLKVMPDAGDSYDWSPIGKDDYQIIINEVDLKLTKAISQNNFKIFEYDVNKLIPKTLNDWKEKNNNYELSFKLQIIKHLSETVYNIQIVQANEDIRVDLVFSNLNVDNNMHWYESQMGLNQKKNEFIPIDNWNEIKLRELPVPNDTFEGTIAYQDNNKISAFATNSTKEYYFVDNNLTFVLFRTAKYLGRANLYGRPGRQGGLTDRKILTPDAYKQIENLNFSFYHFSANNKVDALKQKNKWVLFNCCAYHQSDKYKYNTRIDIWNTPYIKTQKELKKPYVLKCDGFIQSALYKDNNNVFKLRLLNIDEQAQNLEIAFNKNIKVIATTLKNEKVKPKSYFEFEFIEN